jgi:pilus assembly protein Flp/PilA
MRAILRIMARFAKNEEGPTAVEYAVLLALIVSVCMAAIYLLGQNSNTTFGKVGSAIQATSGSGSGGSGGGPTFAP